jgi:hypothetical protein
LCFLFAISAVKSFSGFAKPEQSPTAELATEFFERRGENRTKVPFWTWAESSWPKAQSVILTASPSSCILAKTLKKIAATNVLGSSHRYSI